MTLAGNNGSEGRGLADRTIAVLLIAAPFVVLLLIVLESASIGFIEPLTPGRVTSFWFFGASTPIAFVVGLNRSKQWMPPSVDLYGCIIAFVLCALSAVHVLLLVGSIRFVLDAEPGGIDELNAFVLSLYAAVYLIGAVQASRRARL